MSYDHWKSTNPADVELGSADQRPTIVERFEGVDITRDETGFASEIGDGYPTIEECRADISARWDRWEGRPGKAIVERVAALPKLDIGQFFAEAAEIVSRSKPVCVYPLYLVSRTLRTGLLPAKAGDDGIIAEVGEIKTLQAGSAYQIPVTDTSGTRYRITVEVVS